MVRQKVLSVMDLTPGAGSTLSRVCSTALEGELCCPSRALKRRWTTQELMVHPSQVVYPKHLQLGEAPANQTLKKARNIITLM